MGGGGGGERRWLGHSINIPTLPATGNSNTPDQKQVFFLPVALSGDKRAGTTCLALTKGEKGGEEMDKRGDKRGDPDGYAFDGMGQARFLVDALGSDCWKSEGG